MSSGSKKMSTTVGMFGFAVLLALSVCLPPGFADTESGGKATVQKVVNLFSVWHGKDSSPAVFKEAARIIDYEEMSEKALGARWNTLKPVERTEFVSTFRTLIEERYYRRWHRIFNRAELNYKTEVPVSGDLLIKTVMTVGKKQDGVVWRLSNRSGSYRVISIAVNQKDLLERLSERLELRLRKDSFKRLLSWMREEADQDDNDDRDYKGHTTTQIHRGA
jgi:ABC-type transporter MlaC component